MSTTPIRGSSTAALLDGTLPLWPFHPEGFVGTMQADGQQVRVAALACDETRVVALSLVGFDTSIGVVFSRLWSSTAVPFAPAPHWQEEWRGPEQLQRSGERYKQCVAHLEGTREVHALALVRTAHLTEGILHPPDLPEMKKSSEEPEHLLDKGITAEMLNDDCLGRTLDWLYAHDLTRLFVEIASQARRVFGIKAEQVHVDTTSFSVSGEYAQEGEEAAVIAITYGYSRDHRADLKQWMLALATTHDGDVPLFFQPLSGNSSDKVRRLSAITAIHTQLREAGEEAGVYVADNGVYSEANMKQLNQANVKWVSRDLETMTEAKTLIQEGSERGSQSEDGSVHWFSRRLELSQGSERWVGL